MAELFIKPLVPLPISVSGITIKGAESGTPVEGYVLTSDADGKGTWQPTDESGGNIIIDNPNPLLSIQNSASNTNGTTLILESKGGADPSVGVYFRQTQAGVFNLTNYGDSGAVNITAGAGGMPTGGDVSILSTANDVISRGRNITSTASTGAVTLIATAGDVKCQGTTITSIATSGAVTLSSTAGDVKCQGTTITSTATTGDLSLTSTAGIARLQGQLAVRLIAPVITAYNPNGNVVVSDLGTVTQIGTINTGVTLNSYSGTITTVVAELGTSEQQLFTLTNFYILSDSLINVFVSGYADGSGGFPVVNIASRTTGSCVIRVANLDPLNSTDDVIQIGFLIL